MKINSHLIVTGNITSGSIEAKQVKASGSLNVSKLITSTKLESDQIQAKVLQTDVITSLSGVVTIEGDLVLSSDVSAEKLNVRATSFIVQDVKQWSLSEHDDFESEKSLQGWSDKRTGKCKGGKNTFLGGHCNFSFHEVSKTYKNLPKHKFIRINASYHMFDSWDGETGYMKVDDEIVWTKQGMHSPKGLNICGGDFNDPAYNMYIKKILFLLFYYNLT